MRHKIGNLISVIYSVIKFSIMKIFYGKNFTYHLVERVSPNVVVDIGRKSCLYLGKRVRIHSGTRLTVADQGTLRLGDDCRMNNNCRVACRYNIKIDTGVEFGPGVLVYDHDHDFRIAGGIKADAFKKAEVYIGKNCWIGAGTIILRGTHLGDNCVVGAGSVIKGNFPANSLIVQRRETSYTQIIENAK